jgi:hypothetical protein
MKEFLKEIQEFIDKNSDKYNIEISIKDWKGSGPYGNENSKPIMDIKLTEKVLR